MARILLPLGSVFFGAMMFALGMSVSAGLSWVPGGSSTISLSVALGMSVSAGLSWMTVKRLARRVSDGPTNRDGVTRDDIRSELMRDAFATDLMCNDDTPDDVVRYLYLEAERRAKMRKQGLLADNENDLFSPPHRKPELP